MDLKLSFKKVFINTNLRHFKGVVMISQKSNRAFNNCCNYSRNKIIEQN